MISIGSILFGLALLLAALPYVIRPLLVQKRLPKPGSKTQRDWLEETHRQALAALRDLDFDYQVGKITIEDYEPLRAILMVEAAESLLALQAEDEQLEKAIQARKNTQKAEPAAPARFCPSCGRKLYPGDHFCTRCGEKVQR